MIGEIHSNASFLFSSVFPPRRRYRVQPGSIAILEELWREQLPRRFFTRIFLYFKTGASKGFRSICQALDITFQGGRALAQNLLEPLVEAFGPVSIRSSHRARRVSDLGACWGLYRAVNEANPAALWDRRNAHGNPGGLGERS